MPKIILLSEYPTIISATISKILDRGHGGRHFMVGPKRRVTSTVRP